MLDGRRACLAAAVAASMAAVFKLWSDLCKARVSAGQHQGMWALQP